MISPVVEALCALSILWPAYWILRRFLSRTTLDNVPGPASDSWLIGK